MRFVAADLTVNAEDDGITVSNDGETVYVYVESGTINILSCYEGIEAIDITIAGGEIEILPTDDGINANGRGSNSVIRITGGDITIVNKTGRDADGLDSNGSIYISGGNIFISVNASEGSCAIDCGTENGGVCEISGGTVIAAGSSTVAEGFDPSSEQRFIMYSTSNTEEGTAVSLKNEEGTILLSETVPCSFSSVVISTPDLRMGETCTLSIGYTEAEIVVDNSTDSGGFGMGGMQNNGQDYPQDKPDGSFGGGGRPDGNFDGSEMPEAPDGDFAGNEMPALPDGDFADGAMPGMPNGDFTDNGGFRGDAPAMEWEQNQDSASDSFSLSSETLILTGISILILLAGILFAAKIKH